MKIKANFFKPRGKWYMEEEFGIPTGMSFYDTRIWIEENRPHKNEFIMVIDHEEYMDVIGFPMLDLNE